MAVTITRNPNLSKDLNAPNFDHQMKKEFGSEWWTGLAPEACPGFDQERNSLVALPLLNLNICTREDILAYFNNSWTLTELLFQSLKVEEAFTRPPYHGLRHPLIFYYGHPAVLYINKLRLAGFQKDPINIYLEKVLEIGVDEMSWDDMSKNEMHWPSVRSVREYRQAVYNIIVELIKNHPDLSSSGKLGENSPWWALFMGFEHEKIHFETSSVLMRELPVEYVETPTFWPPLHPSKNAYHSKNGNSWVEKKGGAVHIGKPKNAESFGWDNEYGSRTINTVDFQYTQHQITNAEYLEFVATGGYINDTFWSEEGLQWRKYRNSKRPTFWSASGPEGSHQYELRTIFEMIPLPKAWPVEVNFHEAKAYTNWKMFQDKAPLKYRLMTEAEFVALTPKSKDPVLQKKPLESFKKFSDLQKEYTENFNFIWSSPKEVSSEFYGNTWHWLEDQFNPLEGFEVNSLYDDFSTPCFDGKHQMIRGGSFMSCGHEASHWARFHFRPHFYQHSGFRMAASLDGSSDNGAKILLKTKEYIHPRRQNVLDQMSSGNDWWKKIDQPLELSEDEMQTLFTQTQTHVLKYMKEMPSKSPMGEAHDPAVNGLRDNFHIPYQTTKSFPERPENYEGLMKTIFEDMAKYSQIPGHPGFAAYVAGAGNFISNTAQLIAQTLNPFTGHYMMAPGLVTLEMEVIKWFQSLIGFDENTSQGFLTTGSSLATMSALAMARKEKIQGHDYSKVTGYTSADAHHCVAKAWVMLGLKKENLRLVPLKDYKMNTRQLEIQIEEDKARGFQPFLVVATLGSTKTGCVDSLEEIIPVSKKHNLWLHADGAYGALFMLTEKGQGLFKGIDQTDSVALDPHKALSIPYGTGCLLVKNKDHMLFDYLSDDSYMPPRPTDQVDYADITPELSRDFRGLRLWLPLKTLGIGPFKLNLEEKLKLSEWLSSELSQIKELEIISAPELTILTFAHKKGNEATRALMEKINNQGTLFLSSCTINDRVAIRFCLLGFRLHFDRLEKAVKEIKTMVNL
jgi:5-histidylcysteine sulfoxide synthase